MFYNFLSIRDIERKKLKNKRCDWKETTLSIPEAIGFYIGSSKCEAKEK